MSLQIIKSIKPAPSSKLVADYLMVNTSLVFALVMSWIRNTRAGSESVLLAEAHQAINQYLHLLLPLSLIFPAAFVVSGVYRDHSGWTLGRRAISLLRGLALGWILFVPVSLFFLPESSLGNRSLALFCAFMMIILFSARASEWAIAKGVVLSDDPGLRLIDDRPVLVIGGAGYIGSLLVQKLLQAGRRVRVLDSLIYGDGALRDVMSYPTFELIVGDCRNLQTVIRAVHGVDSIIHLAAIVGDPACAQDGQTALEINYAATRMLIEVAKGQGIQRFVFASSCSTYGVSEELMDETSELNPVSLYAQTKIDSERVLLQACTRDFQPTILRLATVFGLSPRPRFDLVVNLLSAKASQGDPITIFNGEQWRPFIHVSDVAEAFCQVVFAPLSVVGGKIFNLGDARLNFTLTQVTERIRTHFPQSTVEHTATTDRRNYRVSFDLIRSSIGFECSKTLDDGILEIRDAFADGRVLDYTSYQYNNQKFLQLSGSPINQEEDDENVMAAFAGKKSLAAAFHAGV